MSKILVIGGAGYIGSHVNKLLHAKGMETVVFDNLSSSSLQPEQLGTFVQGDTDSRKDLDNVFSTHDFDAVMHFGALINARESVENPVAYYQNNVHGTLNVLDAMQRHGVQRFIFSSTAAVYGLPQMDLMTEEHPKAAINPYGRSKWMIEMMLPDMEKAYGIKYCCLRYFNAAGGDPDGIVKYCQTQAMNLIPIVLKNSLKEKPAVTINGTDYETPDGTCVRDFIHVMDIGAAHLQALDHLASGGASGSFNLGNGSGFSVREVIDTAQEVTGIPLEIHEGPRVAGDPPRLLADASLAKKTLGWTPRYPELRQMIEHMWRSMSTLSLRSQ